ncbi:ABC transporter permease, partial [bacterium]|nr:ABC transporter permease [bacterium]
MTSSLLQDIRYALRILIKNPGYALAVIFTLALGIGANTAVFSFVNGVLFKPLPYKDIDQIVFMSETNSKFDDMAVSGPNYKDWAEMNQSFDSLSAFRFSTMNFSGVEYPERIRALQVTANFFRAMGADSMLGRLFSEDDDKPSAQRTVVLSADFWKKKFNESKDVIGQTVRLHENVYTVIGVLDPGFTFPPYGLDPVDAWVPLELLMDENDSTNRGNHAGIYAVGKLKQGVSKEQAKAEFDAIAKQLESEYPDTNTSNGVRFRSLQERMFEDIHPEMLGVLLAAVGFVLLIACANVSNLMLAKSNARSREIAIRAAMGASRMRIIRQLLSETACLVIVGAGLGIIFSSWGLDWLMSAFPERAQGIRAVFTLDWRVLAYTSLISVFTVIIFGLAPALQTTRKQIQNPLKEGGRAGSGIQANRIRNILVAGQICVALVLLCGSGLLIRSFVNLLHGDMGTNTQNVLFASLSLPNEKYSDDAHIRAFYQDASQEIQSLPGVQT